LHQAAGRLEKHGVLVPAILLALYFLVTAVLAIVRPLWFDELFTFYLSRFSSLNELWSNLAAFEPNPPLAYLLTRASFLVLGEGALATRMPSIVGFGLLLLCLYLIAARWCRPQYAWLALLVPLSTSVYHYAHEARPYGLLLGFCGLSLLCWQAAADGRRRLLALFGLALSLAAGLASHYYAVLVFGPLAIGELVRTQARKRVDLAVWAAFALGSSVLLALLPLIRAARSNTGTFWAPAEWTDIPITYEVFFLRALPPALLGALFVGLHVWVTRLPAGEQPGQTPGRFPPVHELAAALVLALLPVLAMVLGKVVTGVFVDRYTVATVAGVSLLLAFGAQRWAGASAVTGTAVVAVFLAWFLVIGAATYRHLAPQAAIPAQVSAFLAEHCREPLPIAVARSHRFLQLAHYAEPALAQRLVYLSDREASLRFLRHETDELALRGLSSVIALRVVDFGDFTRTHERFYVYGNYGWLVPTLEERGAELEEIATEGDQPLFLVQMPKKP
jgi:4-amino-4-deoxy-L-arabinose transferase-like glycosyltransferase